MRARLEAQKVTVIVLMRKASKTKKRIREEDMQSGSVTLPTQWRLIDSCMIVTLIFCARCLDSVYRCQCRLNVSISMAVVMLVDI